MAFHVELDRQIIRVTFSGDLATADLIAAAAELARIEAEITPIPHRLTDMSDVVGRDLKFGSVFGLALARRERKFPNSFRSAIVAPTMVSRGFARMFQTLNTNRQIEIRIFDNVAAAEEWLGS